MRIGNDYGAKVMADHPKKFGLFTGVPLPDIDGVMKEIEYGLDTLKADGIGIYTNDNQGNWPGDPYFDPMWQELNRRNDHRVHASAGAAVLHQSRTTASPPR